MVREIINFFEEVERRYGKYPRVFISDISSAFVCEYQKVLEKKYGKIETEEMILGKEIHYNEYPYELVSVDRIEKTFYDFGRVDITLKVKFLRNIGGHIFLVSGEPDMITFEENRIIVRELKTRNSIYVRSSDEVQIKLYAYSISWALQNIQEDARIFMELEIIDRNAQRRENFHFGEFVKSDRFMSEIDRKILLLFDKKEAEATNDERICKKCIYIEYCSLSPLKMKNY